MTLNRWNWIVRGQADYGYISDTPLLNAAKLNAPKSSPYNKTSVGKNAVSLGVEAGYDVFSQITKLRDDRQKLYVFGRYEYYNSYVPTHGQTNYDFTKRSCIAAGVNYCPVPQVAVKAHWSNRLLKSQYNNEPSINLGVAYQGFFL